MKIDGNTVLDWEPAIIAKVGSVFLANDVEEDYAPMELHNMTIGMYISPRACVGCLCPLDEVPRSHVLTGRTCQAVSAARCCAS